MGYCYDANKSKPWRKPRWRIAFVDPSGALVDEKGTSSEAGSLALLAMREKDVAKGCWSPLAAATGSGGMPTFEEYARRHIARRTAAGKALAVDGTELGRMDNHVLPRLGKKRLDRIDRDDIERVIAELMQVPAERRLAPKTILAIYGDLRVLFKWAVAKDKLIAVNPCTLTLDMDELPRNEDKDPRWRESAKYARKELIMLLSDSRVPPDRQMLYGLEFLGAMRAGEAAGRRWQDWHDMEEPLEKLLVVTQYDDKQTKTRRPRGMPVHPVLSAMLREFHNYWWPVLYGRKPERTDYIVPLRGRGGVRSEAERGCRNKHTMWSQLQGDLEKLGLRARRQHDLRRSFISMARGDGADKHALKACTHGGKGDVMDDYTTWDWRDQCKAVACMSFELPPREPAVRLAVVDPAASRQGRNGAARARAGAGRAPALTPTAKALAGGSVSARNLSINAVTPTGIESGPNLHFGPDSATLTKSSAFAADTKTAAFLAIDEASLTPGVSELDLRDELLAGAAALLHDRLTDPYQRSKLATTLERAARRFEALAAEARAAAARQRTSA